MAFQTPATNWQYETVPQAGLNGRRGYQPRGRGMGGSSAIKEMLYIRGNADRKRVVKGKNVSVRVDLGGLRIIKKKTHELREIQTIVIMILIKYYKITITCLLYYIL